MSIASPLKWHGGKGAFHGKLAQWIISLMPPHLHYVEPYAGGLSVLLAKDPTNTSEVVNDLNQYLTTFWSVLQSESQFARFYRLCQATPFSQIEYESADNYVTEHSPIGWSQSGAPWTMAHAFFIRCRQSMSGRMKDFAPLTRNRIRRGMNEQASAWLTSVDGLPIVHDRLSRVVVLNRDALDVIRQQDGPNTCFYLDPPYVHETRASTGEYEHEMTIEQHRELLNVLAGVEGKFLLSGYFSDLYHEAASLNDWTRHEFPIVNNAAKGGKKREMVECVWTNFPTP